MMMKLNKKKNKKGFTLIELIVVIAILAIIAALALPAFNNVKDESAQQIADSNARTAYTAAVAAQALNTDVAYDSTTIVAPTVAILGNGYTADNITVTIADGIVTETTWTGTLNGDTYEGTYTP